MIQRILNLLRRRERTHDVVRQQLAVLLAELSIPQEPSGDAAAKMDRRSEDAVRHIASHRGMLSSVIDRTLIAVFGHARTVRRIALEAVRTASAMQSEAAGVGIDYGPVLYGRKKSAGYPVAILTGDPIRVAGHLCELTRLYQLPTLCTEAIRSGAGDRHYYFLEIDRVMLSGSETGQPVYWPIALGSIGEELREKLDLYTQGLQLYYAGNWASAYDCFVRCQELLPARVMRGRTRGQICPKDWNGTFS